MANKTEALYAQINADLKDRATLYATECKLVGRKKTATLQSLIEESLQEYMINHPIKKHHKETQN